jgi:hypothetical protein
LYQRNTPVTADSAYDRLGRLDQFQRGILSDENSDGRFDTADRESQISQSWNVIWPTRSYKSGDWA